MSTIILASHGELAKGMKDSVQMIIGAPAASLEVFCLYPGMNPEDYAKAMKARIEQDNDDYLFVCDILGGSVYTALSQLSVHPRVSICSGMNMNLVLSLLITQQWGLKEEQILTAVQEAKEGITYQNGIKHEEAEDF